MSPPGSQILHKLRLSLFAWRLALVAILLLAFVLRIHTLATRSLWFDESIHYWTASAPFADLFKSIQLALSDPPLYSLLLHFWMKAGQHEFWLRYPSLILSLFAVVGGIVLGKQAFGRGAGLIAGLRTQSKV